MRHGKKLSRPKNELTKTHESQTRDYQVHGDRSGCRPDVGGHQPSGRQTAEGVYPRRPIEHGGASQMRYFLDSKHKDHANADGKMTEEQKREFVKKFEADLITPAEAALWKRGASNAGYHYLGCAKTFALMGKAFAEANLKMLESQRP
jgi:hypothetical protein